jgi:aminoglycoside phosphotransferase (APT) family kinase protein
VTQPIGPKIAEGRDSEIYEHGDGRVLRLNRVARDLRPEAEVMLWVRDGGYPVPEVFDVGNGWLVMERLVGVDLLDTIKKTPAGIRATGALLADLHRRLGEIAAPDWLAEAPGPAGDRMVHLDLHPMNVMVTADGPVVIDWGNAKRGEPAVDVANTWSLLKCGEIPGRGPTKWISSVGRQLLVNEFLGCLDRDAAASVMPSLVEWRSVDRHHSPKEVAKMRRLAAKIATA